MSQLGTEKLVSLESTSRNISASLVVVQSEVSAINAPLRDISDSLTGLDTRLENIENFVAVATQLLAHKPVANGKPQEASS